ncbi:MAG: DUF763 domain-containing protein [Candidatus Aenigmatarchaeota archaeon]
MEKTGSADLPLHGGKAPRWLFKRMEKLTGAISEVIIHEYSQEELLRRLSDPYWFQSLGCVVGFDWHSSGLTTTLTGALKEALDEEEHGVKAVGGKGKTSRKAPEEILSSDICNLSTLEKLADTSKLSAKVDSNCVQDSHNLYHHVLLFAESGQWTVIQQGMNPGNKYARRYHWLSDNVEKFVEEPHEGISAQQREDRVLNLTSGLSDETRKVSVDLVNDGPGHLERYLKPKNQRSVFNYADASRRKLDMPAHHEVEISEVTERTLDNLEKAYQKQPKGYEELVETEGIGKKSLRALALIAQLVHGSENDWDDPAKYSYAHGGKDGYPRPVDREEYDKSIEFLRQALEKADIGKKEKMRSLEKLKEFLD